MDAIAPFLLLCAANHLFTRVSHILRDAARIPCDAARSFCDAAHSICWNISRSTQYCCNYSALPHIVDKLIIEVRLIELENYGV